MKTKPLKFPTVESLRIEIEKYWEKTPKDEWTITGLALALDTSRRVLCEYEDERPEYSNTIKKAKLIVENGYEIDLKKHGRSGTIFALKNFDWTDKSETDITSKGAQIQIPLLDYVRNNNSDKQNTQDVEEDKDSSRGNICEQDYINNPVSDNNGTTGQGINPDKHSI